MRVVLFITISMFSPQVLSWSIELCSEICLIELAVRRSLCSMVEDLL